MSVLCAEYIGGFPYNEWGKFKGFIKKFWGKCSDLRSVWNSVINYSLLFSATWFSLWSHGSKYFTNFLESLSRQCMQKIILWWLMWMKPTRSEFDVRWVWWATNVIIHSLIFLIFNFGLFISWRLQCERVTNYFAFVWNRCHCRLSGLKVTY